ncbi:MAG: histidinol dehydrogenase, partial [Saprospiraceae bacterium]|nr:histidinol dehydrogenase [Pyrinomonadaceae bacterium]
MKVIKYPPREDWEEILKRPALDSKSLAQTVENILLDVRDKGDEALRRYASRFDKIDLDVFEVTEDEFIEADGLVPQELKDAIAVAKLNIEKFHAVVPEERNVIETTTGVFCWRK